MSEPTPGPWAENTKHEIVQESERNNSVYFVIAKRGGRGFTPAAEAEIDANMRQIEASPLGAELAELVLAIEKSRKSYVSGRAIMDMDKWLKIVAKAREFKSKLDGRS